MSKKHLSRLNMPKSWPVPKKINKWIIRPNPGPHQLDRSIPITIILKYILNYAKTTNEVGKILNNKEILVDKKIIKDKKYSLGLFDVLEIPRINEQFVVLLNKKNKFILYPIKKEDSLLKPCKIIKKTILKGKKLQLNLYDSKNIIIDKDDYKVGDTILLNLNSKKIESQLKLEKNSTLYLTGGKHIGNIGTLDKIENDTITFSLGDKKIKTSKRYAFVIPKDFIKNE